MASLNVKFLQNFSFQPEGALSVISVSRDSSSSYTGAFSVDYSSIGITATAGVDFDSSPGTLNFSAGENIKFINIAIFNDASTDPLESFIVTLSNLQASGVSNLSITAPSHSVYIVDTTSQVASTPTSTNSSTKTSTESKTESSVIAQTETSTEILYPWTAHPTETKTHTVSDTATGTKQVIIFPTPTPQEITFPECWCTPTGTSCPPRHRPTPTSSQTSIILPPDAPNFLIVNGKCHQRTTNVVNTVNFNYNYYGDYSNCENCLSNLYAPEELESVNPELSKDEIYQKYILCSVFDDLYWQSEDQSLNRVYGNLLFNQEPVYGASILLFNKDGSIVSSMKSQSNGYFNFELIHNSTQSYILMINSENFNLKLDKDISFNLPGESFILGDFEIKDKIV